MILIVLYPVLERRARAMTDMSTQTDVHEPEPILKRKPRKSSNQQKKSKTPAGKTTSVCIGRISLVYKAEFIEAETGKY